MGYDKPDLGFVVHFQAPGSPVAYYQQVGRAGRALDVSVAVLLRGTEDAQIQDWFIQQAFPDARHVDEVLAVFDDARGPVTLAGVESRRQHEAFDARVGAEATHGRRRPHPPAIADLRTHLEAMDVPDATSASGHGCTARRATADARVRDDRLVSHALPRSSARRRHCRGVRRLRCVRSATVPGLARPCRGRGGAVVPAPGVHHDRAAQAAGGSRSARRAAVRDRPGPLRIGRPWLGHVGHERPVTKEPGSTIVS